MDRQKRYHFHGHSAVSSRSQIDRNILNVTLYTIRPNSAQGKDKRCAAKHPSLRTFLHKGLWLRFEVCGTLLLIRPKSYYLTNYVITTPNNPLFSGSYPEFLKFFLLFLPYTTIVTVPYHCIQDMELFSF